MMNVCNSVIHGSGQVHVQDAVFIVCRWCRGFELNGGCECAPVCACAGKLTLQVEIRFVAWFKTEGRYIQALGLEPCAIRELMVLKVEIDVSGNIPRSARLRIKDGMKLQWYPVVGKARNINQSKFTEIGNGKARHIFPHGRIRDVASLECQVHS